MKINVKRRHETGMNIQSYKHKPSARFSMICSRTGKALGSWVRVCTEHGIVFVESWENDAGGFENFFEIYLHPISYQMWNKEKRTGNGLARLATKFADECAAMKQQVEAAK